MLLNVDKSGIITPKGVRIEESFGLNKPAEPFDYSSIMAPKKKASQTIFLKAPCVPANLPVFVPKSMRKKRKKKSKAVS